MFNPLVRAKLDDLRYRQARLKELFQTGRATAAELHQVAAEIEKVKVAAAEETARVIRREANHTNAQNHLFTDPNDPHPWIY